METLANLESFVQSAHCGSFSEAARQLGLTPAAVSRNVAMLERNLGVRLFYRSTRKLTLTEAGERFLESISGSLETLQRAISEVSEEGKEPAGVLKISLAPTFGSEYLLPLLPEFLRRFPGIRPEWHFENRTVDLVSEGYDAAIGGGFELTPGLTARTLAPAHLVAVASPAYLQGRTVVEPEQLKEHDGIVIRSLATGRLRVWNLRNLAGQEQLARFNERMIVNDPSASREACRLGLGICLLALADVLPQLETGELVRVLPDWWVDAGSISLYYANRRLLPGKTRAFVNFVTEAFQARDYARRFQAF
ncbi:LysR family transcriptional regulator [bacterium SCN 62-11]|nr:MAG: LysR family transcriptional regulator [bacterium SCN 62-11]